MKKDRHIQEEVTQTMRSLESVQQADPGPWFAAKVMRKWEAQASTKLAFWQRPSWQLAAMTVLLLLNLGFVLQDRANSDDRSVYIQALAQQYNLNTTSISIYQSDE